MSVPLHRITRTALIALSSSTVQFCVEKLQNLHQRPRTKIPYQFLIRFYSVFQAFLTHVPWLLKTFEARYIEHHVVNLICNALDKQTSNLQVKYILSSAVQCCAVLYCTVLYCAVLYCGGVTKADRSSELHFCSFSHSQILLPPLTFLPPSLPSSMPTHRL